MRLNLEPYQQEVFEWGYPDIAAMYRRQGKADPKLVEQREILH